MTEPTSAVTQHERGTRPEAAGPDGHAPRFTPAQLARLLGLDEPTPEQAAVVGAPLAPLAVVAGAGSGKSETMAARLVWLVANGFVRPERVLGLTFTRKAAAELAGRVRIRLDGLRRAGLGGEAGSAAAAEHAGTPVPGSAAGPPAGLAGGPPPGLAGGPLAGWAGGSPPGLAGGPLAGWAGGSPTGPPGGPWAGPAA